MTRDSTSLRQNSRISSFARQNTRNTSSSFSRGSRQILTSARSDAKRRVNEVKQELENVLHVLDNGVNRTPVPLQLQQLQRQQNVTGIPPGSAAERESVSGLELNNTSMLLQSSILFGNDLLNNSRLMLDSSFASSSQIGFDRKSSMFNANTATNLEMSSRSISSSEMKSGTSPSLEHPIQGHDRKQYNMHHGRESSANMTAGNDGMNANGALGNVAKMFERPTLWDDLCAASENVNGESGGEVCAMSDLQRRAWRQGTTTITLTETPTILLYTHQDEAVPNDNALEVHEVQSRNAYYENLIEEQRRDEGTRFQSRSTTTFAAPKKSVYCDVHPAPKRDTGPLQVTPWMLKDEFASLLGYDNEDEEEEVNAMTAMGTEGNSASTSSPGNGAQDPENDLESELMAEADTDATNSMSEDQTTRIGTGTSTNTNTNTNELNSNSLGFGRITSSVGKLTETVSTTLSPSVATSANNTMYAATGASMAHHGASGGNGGNKSSVQKKMQQQPWMFAETFLSNLRVMERAVVQNYMEKVQLAYRGIEMSEECQRAVIAGSNTNNHHTADFVNNNNNNNNNNNKSKTWNSTSGLYKSESQQKAEKLNHNSDKEHAVLDADELSLSTPAAVNDNSNIKNNNNDGNATNTTLQDKTTPGALPRLHVSAGVKPLWCYRGKLTANRTVTCMAWNRKEPDILAVGYSVKRTSSSSSEQDCIINSSNNNNKKLSEEEEMKNAKADTKLRRESKNNPSSTSRGRKSMVGERYSEEQRGLICCWSLKNPLAPELVLHLNTDAGVTALSFSQEHPSLLAVGNTEGYIVVYDILKDLCAPSMVPSVNAGLHTGAVWELKWVARGKERGEFLMSISADGRVVQWAIGKSIERVAPDLMHLKQMTGANYHKSERDGAGGNGFVESINALDTCLGGQKRRNEPGNGKRGSDNNNNSNTIAAVKSSNREVLLTRQCGGMCFDVCPSDSAIYVVGTEDGSVFQCNKSQTESYDLEYAPHAELVYRIRWSPYSDRYFLTCSADWTSRLYCLGQPSPLIRFDSPKQDAVQDVAWSYTNALSFATASAQGNVELWMVMDSIYPRSTISYNDKRRLSCLLFAEQENPVIVVGDEEGDVTVFMLPMQLYGRQSDADDEQEEWLNKAIQKQTC